MPASLRVPRAPACTADTRRYYLGAGWCGGMQRDLLAGDPRPREEEETEKGQAAAWQELRPPGPRDPLCQTEPFPTPPVCRWKRRHEPAELNTWAAALQGSFPTSVMSRERHFDTSRSLLSLTLRSCRQRHWHSNAGLRVAATKIHPLDWKNSSEAPMGTPGTGSCRKVQVFAQVYASARQPVRRSSIGRAPSQAGGSRAPQGAKPKSSSGLGGVMTLEMLLCPTRASVSPAGGTSAQSIPRTCSMPRHQESKKREQRGPREHHHCPSAPSQPSPGTTRR